MKCVSCSNCPTYDDCYKKEKVKARFAIPAPKYTIVRAPREHRRVDAIALTTSNRIKDTVTAMKTMERIFNRRMGD